MDAVAALLKKQWRWGVGIAALIGSALAWSCGYFGLAPLAVLTILWPARFYVVFERAWSFDDELWLFLE